MGLEGVWLCLWVAAFFAGLLVWCGEGWVSAGSGMHSQAARPMTKPRARRCVFERALGAVLTKKYVFFFIGREFKRQGTGRVIS